jgi:multisubunit Na+/H+ antiporter MnhC subunit
METRQAILVELFALVLVVSGGFYWLVESGNQFQLLVNLGLIIGAVGVLAGFVGEKQ